MPEAPVPIRLARPQERKLIQRLEDDAGRRYGTVGLPPDLEGLDPALIDEAQRSGLLWVATDGEDQPIGFALCLLRPGAVHLRELDVHPHHMGRGVGRALIEHVCREAKARSLSSVTLTTFRDIPFNAPLYAHLGFSIADPAPDWLAAIRQQEDATVLKTWPRVAMIRSV